MQGSKVKVVPLDYYASYRHFICGSEFIPSRGRKISKFLIIRVEILPVTGARRWGQINGTPDKLESGSQAGHEYCPGSSCCRIRDLYPRATEKVWFLSDG
ncbi:hypothetical protein RRG08_016321 [Elysia crispata]|uniref:Uncharacterized protein n=1 Tax=Elysia crispata TaxID=231223 RepID=A0AAE1AYB3_9GAST|nr:hypothetical protein RRG08_016321 [Elysia crispata]